MCDNESPFIIYYLRPFTYNAPQCVYYKNGTGMTLRKGKTEITLSRVDMVSLLNLLYENIIMRPPRDAINYDTSVFDLNPGLEDPHE